MKMPGTAMKWQAIIKASDKHFQQWNKTCDSIEKRYALTEARAKSASRQFQLFWSNIEVLKPAVYARTPVPVVKPRFTDTRKHIPRISSELLERTCISTFEQTNIDEVMRAIRDDLLKGSRGVSWVRYEAEGPPEEPEFIASDGRLSEGNTDEDEDDGELRGVGDNGGPPIDEEFFERVIVEYLPRNRFGHDVADTWTDIDCAWRIDFFSRDQMIDRFLDGTDDQDEITAFFIDKSKEGADEDKGVSGSYKVYQLWCRSEGKVYWLTMDAMDVIDERNASDILQLEGFFPCAKPVYATVSDKGLIPVPDYVYYEDQIDEINELTARIAALSNSLRMRGFYNSGSGDLKSSIEKAMGTVDDAAILVPIKDMKAAGTNQSLSSAIAWIPIDQVSAVITQLVGLRQQLITDVYEIVGISDIQRGSSNPNETLGAQRLKAQNGSVRVRERQLEMQRHARDVTRLMGEIIAENFDPETLMQMSQMELPNRPEPQLMPQFDPNTGQMTAMPAPMQQPQGPPKTRDEVTIEDVIEFLRDQRMRSFSTEIETDSTIQADEDAEKARRTEFMTALGTFLEKGIQAIGAAPETAPLVAESLRFVVGGFRAGRALEGVIDELADEIEEKARAAAQQPPQEQPNPELIKVQSQIQLDTEKANNEIEISRTKAANDMFVDQVKAGINSGMPPVLQPKPPVQLPMSQQQAPQPQAAPAPQQDPNLEVIERLVAAMNAFVSQNQNMNAQLSQRMVQTMESIVQRTDDLVRAVNKPRTMELLQDDDGNTIGSREVSYEDEGY